MACRLCDDSCVGAAFGGLLTADLAWVWGQLADTADRRGDRSLATGTTTVTVPPDVAGRTAAAGLLGRRHLTGGQRVRVDLAALAEHTAPATPGAVAAHATGRTLAMRAAAKAARVRSEGEMRDRLAVLVPAAVTDTAWAALRRSGWVTKILRTEGRALLDRAAAVIELLPAADEPPVDRRRLAHDATGDPHDLDRNRAVTSLTLALLAAAGRTSGDTPRDIWASVGVVYDDITGGLTTVGIVPDHWMVPARAPVTLPPRVLAESTWPAGHGRSVYVTENPSVLSAAIEIDGVRLVCTSGTPSRGEVAALARLADAGWQLHVRADFDDAGVNHMNAIVAAAPAALPWRMSAADYVDGLKAGESIVALRTDRLTAALWDPDLHPTMTAHGVAVYEEALLERLIADVQKAQ